MSTTTEKQLEIRFIQLEDVEVRAGSTPEQPHRLVGYAAKFNSLSSDLGGFKERLMPGAFKNSTTNGQDIRALMDHNSEKLLGRTSNGTLRAAEDETGLRIEVDLPNTSYANDLRELVKRKDVKGMSFGFRVPEGGQRFTKEGGQTIRELTNVDLREVSATSIPAYDSTSLAVRSVDPSVIRQIQQSSNDRTLFAQAQRKLRNILCKG